MAQRVKDLMFSLLWLWLLLWLGFDPWPGELVHAMGMGKKVKEGVLFVAQRVTNPTSNHENMGLIPGLAP